MAKVPFQLVRPHPLVRPIPPGPVDVVADVHGESSALDDLLGHLGYDSEGRHPDGRRLVFVGDLIDRGPDSMGVIDRLGRMMAGGGALAVLGNHEMNLLRGRRKPENDWYFNASPKTRRRELGAIISNLPLALERDDLRVVHASWCDNAIAIAREVTCPLKLFDEHDTRLEALLDAEGVRAAVSRELRHQNDNPVKLLTSGPEKKAKASFQANGETFQTTRQTWWDDYNGPLCVVGHYWRAQAPGHPTANHLFDDSRPHAPLGAGKVMCIDYSVGWRFRERLQGSDGFTGPFQLKLAALRVPEMSLMFDDGTSAPLG